MNLPPLTWMTTLYILMGFYWASIIAAHLIPSERHMLEVMRLVSLMAASLAGLGVIFEAWRDKP